MKIKNLKLMLVSAFLMMGSAAFATTQYAVYSGVRYSYDDKESGKNGSAENPFTATVYGITADATSIAIPASFSKTDENDVTLNFVVGSFASSWTHAADLGDLKHKDVRATLTTLSIDIKNMTALTNAYADLTALASLTISDSKTEGWTLTSIANLSLTAAVKKSLTTLNLSGYAGCVEIANSSFKPTTDVFEALTSVTLPTGLKRMEYSAFENSKITSITIPENLEYIGNYAFAGASALATADFSANKKLGWIGTNAFMGAAITSFAAPATLTEIKANAFENCAALTSVDLSKATELATISNKAFKGAGVTSIDLSTTKVKAINSGVFKNSQLASITFAEGTTGIEAEAFENAALTTIELPATLGYVGNFAFNGCESLATVDMSATEKLGWIGANAFAGTAITAVTLPNTVTEIKNYAFQDCKSLATFTVADPAEEGVFKLTKLGDNVFKNCEALTSVDLTNTGITAALGKKMFTGCAALATVALPSTVTALCTGLFEDAVIEDLDLSETAITTLNPLFKATTDEKPNTTLKTLSLPAVNIPANAFQWFVSLTEVTWGDTDGSHKVLSKAFLGCYSLVKFAYEAETDATGIIVADDAFYGCKAYVSFIASDLYIANHPTAPQNCKYGDGTTNSIETVADAGTSGKFFARFNNPVGSPWVYTINPDDAKVYSIYVDQGKAYFQALRKQSGQYKICAGDNVIIKTDEKKTIEMGTVIGGASSVLIDNVFCFKVDTDYGKFQANYNIPANLSFASNYGATIANKLPSNKWVYRLTNNKATGGFGFTYFSGTKLKAGQFFILSDQAPSAGRLDNVWLDEDGNVEGDATAINKIQSKTEDGAIYNLQGVRVNAAKKGLYIQNGKKYIVK